ncbi:hypothetical protein SPLC1_S130560 [Arthrospira platensis C1]|nr:hypothetical protein SPLC1_S130560 [Arthrospira platensis C1]
MHNIRQLWSNPSSKKACYSYPSSKKACYSYPSSKKACYKLADIQGRWGRENSIAARSNYTEVPAGRVIMV